MTQARPELVRIGDVAENLGIPVWTVRRMADAGEIPFERSSGRHRLFDLSAVRASLSAPTADDVPRLDLRGLPSWEGSFAIPGLEEHIVWRRLSASLDLREDKPSTHLLEFSIDEMVNNAIDHSGGDSVAVSVRADEHRLSFSVIDDGSGAFDHLRRGLGLADNFEAITAMTKGKQTTWRTRHSGEGVFFTSKMADVFQMSANGLRWTVDNRRWDQAVGISSVAVGTTVEWEVDTETSRTATAVFQEFMGDDFAFERTRPSVKLASLGLRFASRSEARRLMNGLEEFTDIDLDFAGVRQIGQGFVDEVFRVWAQAHPDRRMTPIHMNAAVEFMVRRGLR